MHAKSARRTIVILMTLCLALPIAACGRRSSSRSSASSGSSDAPATVEQVQNDQGSAAPEADQTTSTTQDTTSAEQAAPTDEAAPTDQAAPTEQDTSAEQAPANSPYAVTIDGAQVAQNRDGESVAIVTYTFTNNSDKETSFSSACTTKVFQNGVECEFAYGVDYDSNAYMKEIQPGTTYQVQRAYKITDMSPIDVKVEEFSFNGPVLAEKTLTLE